MLAHHHRLIAAILALAACDGSSPGEQPRDAALPDAGVDAEVDAAPSLDAAVDAAAAASVGSACSSSEDCAADGASANVCSSEYFTTVSYAPGSRLPDPVCIAASCDPGDGETIPLCDDGHGYCTELLIDLPATCMPLCRFGNDAAPPTGCTGSNICVPTWYDRTAEGIEAVGYCSGGCTEDADCRAGDRCQREIGYCVTDWTQFTRPLGTPCRNTDPFTCFCRFDARSLTGYCTQVCRVGDPDACPDGFTCDPGLLPEDPDGDVFTVQPVGLRGICQMNCEDDSDCPNETGRCVQSGGSSGKTCFP